MRHLPILLGAAVLGVSLFAASGQADAAPLLPLSDSTSNTLPVEKAGYYGRRWYGGGYCYRPYGYRRYGYGYGYRPYRRHGWRYGY